MSGEERCSLAEILSDIMRNIYKSLLGIIISALFIYLAFRGIDLRLMISYSSRYHAGPIALCIIGQLATQILHWIRWGLILRRLGQVTWGRVFIMGAIGNAALFILPARSGELVRPTLASRENEIDFGQASATSAIERIADGLLVSAILFVSLTAMKKEMALRSIYYSGLAFLAIILGGSLILFISNRYQEASVSVIRRAIGWLSSQWADRLVRLFNSFIQGIRLSSDSNILLPYLGLSVALWGMDIISIYWLFGTLSHKLPFIAALIVIAALALGSLVPSGPARLGVFEFTIAYSLGIFSVGPEEAVLFATLFHIIAISLVLFLGILGLWLGRQWLKLSARNMRKSSLK